MSPWLRRPPTYALLATLLSLAIGALVGMGLVSFQDALYAAARAAIIRRPEVHGFAGSELIDQARIAEIADQSNTAVRLLHSHSLGIGALILLATVAIVNLPGRARFQSVLCTLVSLGAVYPLGYAVMAFLIPVVGVDVLRTPVEVIFFVPFGGAVALGLLGSVAMCVIEGLGGWEKQTPGNDAVPSSAAE